MSNFSKIKWHFPASSNYTDYIENIPGNIIENFSSDCSRMPGSTWGNPSNNPFGSYFPTKFL